MRIGPVELDLDPEGLVGVADHVLPLVLGCGRSAGEALELPVEIVVGQQRAVAFGNLLTLNLQEFLPEPLGLLLLALDPLSIAPGRLNRAGVEVSPLRGLHSRLLLNGGEVQERGEGGRLELTRGGCAQPCPAAEDGRDNG